MSVNLELSTPKKKFSVVFVMSGSSASKIKEQQALYNEKRKRKREASKTSRYLFEISVPDGDDERLTRIKERLRNVKDVMCIDGKILFVFILRAFT